MFLRIQGKNFAQNMDAGKTMLLENLFASTYRFCSILTYHASLFPLTSERCLLFNKYLWNARYMSGTAG